MAVAIGGGVPIKDVLSSQWRLHIPDYQREYAWDEQDCLQLARDFAEELANWKAPINGTPNRLGYYLGTIVLAALEDNGPRSNTTGPPVRRAEIVDGQQRLATLTILLACLRDLEKEAERKARIDLLITGSDASAAELSSRFILSLRGRDAEFLQQFVQVPGATTRPVPANRLLKKRKIAIVRQSLHQLLAQKSDAERRAMVEFIADACQVAVVTTSSREQAWRIFGRVNQRGKRLRTGDILKALIIGAIPAGERARHLAAWDEYQSALGADFEGDALGRRYLFNYIADLSGQSGSILDRVIAQVEAQGPANFMDRTFVPIAGAYLTILKQNYKGGSQEQRESVTAYLKQLSWLPDMDWVELAILSLRHFSDKPEALIRHLSAIDCFAYGRMLLHRNRHKLKFRGEDRIRHAWAALAQAREDVDLHKILRWERVELRLIRDALTYGLTGGAAKAVLARLVHATNEVPLADCDSIVRNKKWEVEHMVPISPRAGNDWAQMLGPGINVGQYAKKLGNLFLVSSRMNDLLDNGGWAHKSAILAKHPDEPLLPASRELRSPGGWNGRKIDARHQALFGIAESLWNLHPTVKPKTNASPPKKARRPRRRAKSKKSG